MGTGGRSIFSLLTACGAGGEVGRRAVGEIRHPLDSPTLPGVEGVRTDESMPAQPGEAHSIIRR